MKLKKYNLFDELNKLDDATVEHAIQLDSAEKLRNEKKKYKQEFKMKIFNFMPVCAGAVCAIALGVVVMNRNVSTNVEDERLQITSPICEVESATEMKKYLGFDVPVIKNENVQDYIVVGFDNYADLGRIIYNDNSEFRIAKKGYENVSGIYGGTLNSTENINGIDINLYTYEDYKYATWEYKDFVYSYIFKGSDNITEFIEEIINEIL